MYRYYLFLTKQKKGNKYEPIKNLASGSQSWGIDYFYVYSLFFCSEM